MITFNCTSCGVTLRLSDDKAGRRGKCPQCDAVIVVPAGQTAMVAAPQASSPPLDDPEIVDDEPSRPPLDNPEIIEDELGQSPPPNGPPCPSCRQPLPLHRGLVAKICVRCGIHVPSGRPLLVSQLPDEDMIEVRGQRILWWLSWIIPVGIYPIYSEAYGKHRPYATWGIALVTILISGWFLGCEWSGSTQMRWMKDLEIWPCHARVDARYIVAFYERSSNGDREAFIKKLAAIEEAEKPKEAAKPAAAPTPTPAPAQALPPAVSAALDEMEVEDKATDRQILAAYESMTPEQKCLGTFHWYQVFTHVYLHSGIMHLAGNLLFLMIFGSRVNSAIGNIPMLVLYPLLGLAGCGEDFFRMNADPMPSIGASGAIMALAGMYLILYPVHRVHMAVWWRWGWIGLLSLHYKFFVARGFWVVLSFIVMDVILLFVGSKDNVGHWAHVGGFSAGMVVATILLASRLVYSGGDALSLMLGRYAWPLLGRPHVRQGRQLIG